MAQAVDGGEAIFDKLDTHPIDRHRRRVTVGFSKFTRYLIQAGNVLDEHIIAHRRLMVEIVPDLLR